MNLLKHLFKLCLLLLMPLSFLNALSEEAIKERMKSDLDTIRNIFDVKYALKQWKYEYCGWDLDEEINKAKQKIDMTTPITTKDYQLIVRDFIHSAKDYHVDVAFHSTEKASLPFQVNSVGGKYFISYVNTDDMPESVCEGDELVLFDGGPTDEVIKELMEARTQGCNQENDLFNACKTLTFRYGRAGDIVSKGSLTIGVKSPHSSVIQEYELTWKHDSEQIVNHFMGGIAASQKENDEENELLLKFKELLKQDEWLSPRFEYYNSLLSEFQGLKSVGGRESVVPNLGQIVWDHDSFGFGKIFLPNYFGKYYSHPFFKAYLYKNDNNQLIGYVRIPSYRGESQDVKEFADIISYFQKNSDALVIDQIDNPGGTDAFCLSLISMLSDQPLNNSKHRIIITQRDVAESISFIDLVDALEFLKNNQRSGLFLFGFPFEEYIKSTYDHKKFILSEWSAGRSLTEPCSLMGMDQINPHPHVCYTKPILVLINGCSASCGDIFPAILQDNKRATLFGTRTAGAGGVVIRHSFDNKFGIDFFNTTISHIERENGDPIENLGVMPDIPYEITEEDIRSEYRPYANEINKAVKSLIKPWYWLFL